MSKYTAKQEAALTSAAPVTYVEAAEFGVEFGKSTRSVIAKVKSLDLDYICKVIPAKKATGPTKAELVAEITVRLTRTAGAPNLVGLEKATVGALTTLVGTL